MCALRPRTIEEMALAIWGDIVGVSRAVEVGCLADLRNEGGVEIDDGELHTLAVPPLPVVSPAGLGAIVVPDRLGSNLMAAGLQAAADWDGIGISAIPICSSASFCSSDIASAAE